MSLDLHELKLLGGGSGTMVKGEMASGSRGGCGRSCMEEEKEGKFVGRREDGTLFKHTWALETAVTKRSKRLATTAAAAQQR
jgi:hypothetical protein